MDVELFFFKYGAIHYHMHAQVFSDLSSARGRDIK